MPIVFNKIFSLFLRNKFRITLIHSNSFNYSMKEMLIISLFLPLIFSCKNNSENTQKMDVKNSNRLDTTAQTVVTENGYTKQWWKEAVVYQVYPRSFKDSNGDGIGDLRGITSELDYLKNLGVDVIWLSPMFDSPNADNGYDVRDYQKIMDEFGTMADFDELLRGVKERGMKLILDLVANHTSDEHKWFVESRKSKDNPYRDYYIWRSPKNGKEPNDWKSYFQGSAWKKDSLTGEYHLHLFAEKQPDLNWDNRKVRTEVYDIMKFWLDKGTDGFRLDVIPFISKDTSFPNYPRDFDGDLGKIYAGGPHLHEYIQEMNREVLSKYNVMTVGEAAGVSLNQTPDLVDERRKELNMIFQFDIVNVDREKDFWKWKPWNLVDLKAIYSRYETAFDSHSWNAIFISNHDNPRAVSRFGNDNFFQNRINSAKLLATMLLTLKGTPYIYQGDELGMTNYPFSKIEEFDDIQTKNAWKEEILKKKGDPVAFLENQRKTSRDNARTPMQWNDSPNAGFTTGKKTWLPVNPNFKEINAKEAVANPNSVFHFFKNMMALRKKTPALIYGNFEDIDPTNPSVFCYTRTLGAEKYLIVLNFGRNNIDYIIPEGIKAKQLLMTNAFAKEENVTELFMNAHEARVYKL